GRAGMGAHRSLRVPPRHAPAPRVAAAHRPRTRRSARAAARARTRHPHQGGQDRVSDDRRRHARGPRSRARAARADHHHVRDHRQMESKRPVKYILVTGGVVSSLGKGLAAASIGALLEGHGYKVALQKFDPYINVDPGTMSPYQHGEVYVTDDGAETDLD